MFNLYYIWYCSPITLRFLLMRHKIHYFAPVTSATTVLYKGGWTRYVPYCVVSTSPSRLSFQKQNYTNLADFSIARITFIWKQSRKPTDIRNETLERDLLSFLRHLEGYKHLLELPKGPFAVRWHGNWRLVNRKRRCGKKAFNNFWWVHIKIVMSDIRIFIT